MEGLGDAAGDVTEALLNVPEGFKVALAAFGAATPTALVSPVAPGASDVYAGGGASTVPASEVRERPVVHRTINNHITARIESSDPERQWRELKRVIQREEAARGAEAGPHRVAS